MEAIDNNVQKLTQKDFVKHVFNFDNDTKSELMNIVQYVALALIPVTILNNVVKHVIPEADQTKTTLEIVIEVLGQIVIVLLGLFFSHRLVTYLPTYSGKEYVDINLIPIILITLVLMYDIQGKLGMKINFLSQRASDMWNGRQENMANKSEEKKKKASNKVTVSQPISEGMRSGRSMPPAPVSNPSRAPTYNGGSNPNIQDEIDHHEASQTGQGNYHQDAGYPGLVGAAEPMAANEALGGGFSSW
jgi:hypothetical protein